jgi:hypothetical protein
MFGIIGKWNNPGCAQRFRRMIEPNENGPKCLPSQRPRKAMQAKQQKCDCDDQSGKCIHFHADSHTQKFFASVNKLI